MGQWRFQSLNTFINRTYHETIFCITEGPANDNRTNQGGKREMMNIEEKGKLPLSGVRVLDLSRLIPGAVCTSQLGDAGADVIKVEDPFVGDYERNIQPSIQNVGSRHLILNRNKKSFSVNLKEEKGRDLFLQLCKSADVIIESFRPGTMKKLGLDYDQLSSRFPKLIYCSISSFGQEGAWSSVIAHDINILSMCGLLDITGTKQAGPVLPGLQIADSVAGMYATTAVLLALLDRKTTKIGRNIDISMFDGLLTWMFDAVSYVFAQRNVPGKGRGRLRGLLPNYNVYQTKDRKFIAVGSIETKFKRKLLEKLGWAGTDETEDSTTSQPTAYDDELYAFLKGTFRNKTLNEWMDELGELNVCISPVLSVEEALSHPATISRDMIVMGNHAKIGEYRQMGSALKSSIKLADTTRLPAPGHGQDTRAILSELGYTEEQIDSLIQAQIVRAENCPE